MGRSGCDSGAASQVGGTFGGAALNPGVRHSAALARRGSSHHHHHGQDIQSCVEELFGEKRV